MEIHKLLPIIQLPYHESHDPTQVNGSHHEISQAGRYSTYVSRKNRRLSWFEWLVICRDGWPVRRKSPIHAK